MVLINGNKLETKVLIKENLAVISFLRNNGVQFSLSSSRVEIFSPEYIDIYKDENRYSTLCFINSISHLIFRFNLSIHINFSNLKGMSAAASVMLFSEITTSQIITKQPNVITFTQPSDKNAKAIFSDFDFYKAIRPGTIKKVNRLLKDDCFFQSGIAPVKHAKSAINSLKKNGLKVEKPEAKIFQASILEAMSNVRHHSYSDNVADENRRWWQFTYFDHNNSSLHFVIYDSGMGIPKTMGKTCPDGLNDGEKIEYALTLGVSSKVDEPGRGKGSREILKTYDKNDDSSLLIYSGHGIYYKDKEDGTKIVEEGSYEIKGTIIEWQIPYKAR